MSERTTLLGMGGWVEGDLDCNPIRIVSVPEIGITGFGNELDADGRIALANALVPDGVYVADPVGLWAIVRALTAIAISSASISDIEACEQMREEIRAALEIGDNDANEGV